MGPRGFRGARRRGRRRGLIVGAAIGASAARARSNQDQPEEEPASEPEQDSFADLEKLAQLHDSGVLTDEEFQAKKKQLLGI
jgi:hypothetical protein